MGDSNGLLFITAGTTSKSIPLPIRSFAIYKSHCIGKCLFNITGIEKAWEDTLIGVNAVAIIKGSLFTSWLKPQPVPA